jgi:hypothetical protein
VASLTPWRLQRRPALPDSRGVVSVRLVAVLAGAVYGEPQRMVATLALVEAT